ncbi:MAG: cytidine deaminase [Fimbriimonadaceae bacterium]
MNDLVAAAAEARSRAYAPYSRYAVGAAAQSSDGRVWTGANVENVSFGLSLCAERSAIAKMVNDGVTELAAIAVVTRDGGTPCGMCLQTMLEFALEPAKVAIVCMSETGARHEFSLSELIPHGFCAQL